MQVKDLSCLLPGAKIQIYIHIARKKQDKLRLTTNLSCMMMLFDRKTELFSVSDDVALTQIEGAMLRMQDAAALEVIEGSIG